MKRNIILISVLALSGTLFAQSDDRNPIVNVENDYDPVVIEATKLSFTPSPKTASEGTPVECRYSNEGVPFKGFTSTKDIADVLPKKDYEYPDYVRLGYGLTNDIDAKACFNFNVGKRGVLRTTASFDGFKTGLGGLYDNTEWDSRLFRTTAGIGYTLNSKYLKLDVDGKFNNDVFNYQSYDIPLTNKQNSRSYLAGVNGVSKHDGAFQYDFNASFGYLARSYSSGVENGIGEGRYAAGFGLGYEIENDILHSIGLDMDVEGLIYEKRLQELGRGYVNTTSIDVAPNLTFSFDEWILKVGTRMNFITDGASLFAIAPDIHVEKNLLSNFTVFGSIVGDRTLNSFASLDKITPYWGLDEERCHMYKPTYKIVDLNMGLRYSLADLSINVLGGYAYTKDDMQQNYSAPIVGWSPLVFVDFVQSNTHDLFVSARVGYNIFSWVKLSAAARYDFWSCSNRDWLRMKPEVTADVDVEARFIEDLTVRVGFNYTCYTKGSTLGRINHKYDLNARVNYQINKHFGVYMDGNNLLNCKYYDYAGYMARGARGSLGLTMSF